VQGGCSKAPWVLYDPMLKVLCWSSQPGPRRTTPEVHTHSALGRSRPRAIVHRWPWADCKSGMHLATGGFLTSRPGTLLHSKLASQSWHSRSAPYSICPYDPVLLQPQLQPKLLQEQGKAQAQNCSRNQSAPPSICRHHTLCSPIRLFQWN
jgi:hypothetical protein